VFAKLRGYPYWPARIVSLHLRNKIIKYDVVFFGTQQIARLNESSIAVYNDENNEKYGVRKYPRFFDSMSELFIYQLKHWRKQVVLGRSLIHNIGVFSGEEIEANVMIVQYVGTVMRSVLCDMKEKQYQKEGIQSTYMFEIDGEYVIDATKFGNIARYINHSCEPNCYARVDIERQLVVIYSKRHIYRGFELTIDYKHATEKHKIKCLCNSRNCRTYLN